MGKRELDALLNLSSWCLVIVERLFLSVPEGFCSFVIVVFPDHTHLLFLVGYDKIYKTFRADCITKVYFSLDQGLPRCVLASSLNLVCITK